MEPLVELREDGEFPKWAYGAIAGGVALLSGTVVVVGHFVSKRRRQKVALENIRKSVQEQDQLTPRGDADPKPN